MLVGAPRHVPGAEVTFIDPGDDYGVRAIESAEPIDWSSHERDASIGGRRLRYVEIGTGNRLVVLVHGFSALWRVWTDVMPALARHHRVVAVDLPGFGDSELPGEPTMDAMASGVVELIRQLTTDRCPVTVVGHSMGTLVATEIAAAAPELVQRIVLLGGPCSSAVRVVKQPWYALKAPNLLSVLFETVMGVIPMPARLHRLVATNVVARSLLLRPYAHKPGRIDQAMIANLLHGFGARANHLVLRQARHYDYDRAARAVTCPVDVIHGDKDLLVPPADVERLAAMAPVERVVVLRLTGHNAEVERPNTLNRVLLDLLANPQTIRRAEVRQVRSV